MAGTRDTDVRTPASERKGGRAKRPASGPRDAPKARINSMDKEALGLVGEGSFGCVFAPPIKCTGPAKGLRNGAPEESPPGAKGPAAATATGLVSKVFFDKTDYANELRTSREVAKIDPTGDLMLIPRSRCDTTREAVLKHPAGYLCEKHSEYPDVSLTQTLHQFIMPHGGVRLDHYIADAAAGATGGAGALTPKQLLAVMMPVLEGIAALANNRRCHQDIKTSNILVAPARKGSVHEKLAAEHNIGEVARIIDYSLMIPLADVYAAANRRRWKFSYFPYPPEYKMFNYIYNALGAGAGAGAASSTKITPSASDKEAVLSEVKKNWMSFGERRGKAYYKLFGAAKIRDAVGDTLAWLATAGSRAKLEKTLAPFAEKLDIYSLGMVFVDVTRHVSLAGYPHTGRWMRAFRAFVRGMAHPDPRVRLSAHEALVSARELMAMHVRAAERA